MKIIYVIGLYLFLLPPLWGQGEKDLAKMLKSPDPEIRSDACLALGARGREAAVLLLPLLQDESMLVRHCAAYSLSRIGGPTVESAFREGLKSSNYDLRRVSALGLGMMGGKDALETIGPLLQDKNWEVRWAAAYALGKSNDRRALGLLGPVAQKDPQRDEAGGYPVREAARAAMQRLNSVVGWQTDLAAGLAGARARGKPVLLYFRKTGSRVCPQFEEKVFAEEKIADAAQRYVCVWLDHAAAPAPFDRFAVARVPTLVFLSPAGRELGRVEGTLAPEDLQAKMLQYLEGDKNASRLKARLRENPADEEANWQLAELYLDEGAWDRALEQLNFIITQDPYNQAGLLDNALFARAYIRGKLGDYQSSRREFRELLERFPSFGDRAQALYCWGLSDLKVGQQKEGEEVLQRLVKEYPGTKLAETASALLSQSQRK